MNYGFKTIVDLRWRLSITANATVLAPKRRTGYTEAVKLVVVQITGSL